MRHLGDPSYVTKSGGTQQIVLFDQAGPRVTIHGDLIGPISVEKAATGTAMLSVELSGAGDVLRIPEMVFAEVWGEDPGPPAARYCLGKFRIDYWKASHDAGKSQLTVHARGPLGLLIDQPLQLAFSGELEELVARICNTSAPTEIVGLGSRPVSAYINCDSAYAALRLIGVSVGFVIHDDSSGFRIKVTEQNHNRRLVESKPRFEINDSNTLGGTYTKGSPLKKRT